MAVFQCGLFVEILLLLMGVMVLLLMAFGLDFVHEGHDGSNGQNPYGEGPWVDVARPSMFDSNVGEKDAEGNTNQYGDGVGDYFFHDG